MCREFTKEVATASRYVEKQTKSKGGPRLLIEEDENDEEERISFTVKENKREDEYHRKILRGREEDDAALTRPQKYDLPGIRERMKSTLAGMKEVHRRYEMDADRAVDDLIKSQTEIVTAGDALPGLAVKQKLYQELRGFVTDLTDCYDEKVDIITYLEERINGVYSEQRESLRERRRQSVRDQADVLAAMTATNMALLLDPVQDAVRDFRVAEREGGRIRRTQARQGRGEMGHNDGLSSDDEMLNVDAAILAKVKQDVENQSIMLLDDVVDETSVISRVMERLQAWRTTDPDSYQPAYVSLCLPMMFSPLVSCDVGVDHILTVSLPRSGCKCSTGHLSPPALGCLITSGTVLLQHIQFLQVCFS